MKAMKTIKLKPKYTKMFEKHLLKGDILSKDASH